jgi:hypothetical protein
MGQAAKLMKSRGGIRDNSLKRRKKPLTKPVLASIRRSMKAPSGEELIQKRNGPVSQEEAEETMRMLVAPSTLSWLQLEKMYFPQEIRRREARERWEKTDRWLNVLTTENPDLLFPKA